MDNLIRGIRVLHQNAIRIEANGRVLYFDPYGVQGAPHDADYILSLIHISEPTRPY